MKIAICTESYWPWVDGGAVAERRLALKLIEKGHAVIIFAPHVKEYKDEVEKDGGTTIYRLKSMPLPLMVKQGYRVTVLPRATMEKVIKDEKPDLLHVHNQFPIGRAALAIARKLKIPVIITNHWLPENFLMFMTQSKFIQGLNFLNAIDWAMTIGFLNKFDFVTSPTQTAINLLVDHGLHVKNRPNSNGIDMTKFNTSNDGEYLREKYDIKKKPTIIYTGRLSKEKYINNTIEALPFVRQKVDAQFLIAGGGVQRQELERIAIDLGLKEHVRFAPFMDEKDFPNIYRIADVFCIPSICELQSIVALEAMASGLPVVAANRYALPELCHDGENGFLIEPFDVHGIAEALIKILTNPGLKKKFSDESVRIAKTHDLNVTVDGYLKIYEEVIASYENRN